MSPFNRRLAVLMKSDRLTNTLPMLISDVGLAVEVMADTGPINPFVDIYRLVFTLTIRIVGAHELAEDTMLRA